MNKKVSFIDKLKQKIEDYIRKNKQKKEDEKKKKEEIRIWQLNNYGKYYSKPKVIFLTITGLFFGLFEKSSNEKEIKLNKIDTKDIILLDSKELENTLKEVKKIEIDIASIKEDNVKEIQKNKEKIIVLKENIKKIDEKYVTYRKKYNNEFIRQSPKVIPEVAVIYEKGIDKVNKIEDVKEKVTKKLEEKESKIEILDIKEKEDLKLKSAEQIAKEELSKKEIDNLLLENMSKEEAMIVSSILNEVEKNKNEKDIQEENHNVENIKVTDNHKSDENKENIVTTENNNLEEKNKDENKEKQEKIIKRTENDLAEIRLMETLIYNNLKKQKKEIEKYRKKIEKLDFVEKKRSLLSRITLSIRNVTRIVFSLFPLSLFKNKKLGLLTSAIFVNNSIRNMRNSINKVSIPYIEYDKIANMLRKEEKETESAIMICYDSLDQIEELKKDFLLELNYQDSKEAVEILNSINKLEMMVEARAKELDKTYNNIQNVKEKGKQKIKKLEDLYNK